MKAEQVELSIVIPAYNEEKRISHCLEEIIKFFKQRGNNFEVIVVDDGSSDRTLEIVARKVHGVSHQILGNLRNQGKGFSVRKGVLAANGNTILFVDSDLSTPIEEFDKLQVALNEGSDIAIGSRATPSSQVEVHQSCIRETMGRTFNLFAQFLAIRGIHDSQCGFKAFKCEAAKSLFRRQKLTGFCFDAEILFLSRKMGFRIKEIGVRWKNSPQSKVRIFRDSVSMLVDLFRIQILHFGEKF